MSDFTGHNTKNLHKSKNQELPKIQIDLTNPSLLEGLDAYISKRTKILNDESEKLMVELYKEMGASYTMPQNEKDLFEKYRKGYCGNGCDDTLDFLSKLPGLESEDIKKMGVGTDHMYLQQKDLVLDTTYKQFMYAPFITNGTPKDSSSQDCINKIDQLPNIFVGEKKELINTISETLKSFGVKEDIVQDAVQNWKTDVPPSKRVTAS